ncbi:unnamed protein product, partial [Didymodactylos carnosus]
MSDTISITFQVNEVYKGSIKPGELVKIQTSLEPGMCGILVELNQQWQIWAYGKNNSATICDSTQNIDDNRNKLMEFSALAEKRKIAKKIRVTKPTSMMNSPESFEKGHHKLPLITITSTTATITTTTTIITTFIQEKKTSDAGILYPN